MEIQQKKSARFSFPLAKFPRGIFISGNQALYPCKLHAEISHLSEATRFDALILQKSKNSKDELTMPLYCENKNGSQH